MRCSSGWSTCTAMSRSTPTATRSPSAWWAKPVSVYKYPAEIHIHHRGSLVATHPRLIGQRDAQKHCCPATITSRSGCDRTPAHRSATAAAMIRSSTPMPRALKQRGHGRGARALRRLLEIKRTYPKERLRSPRSSRPRTSVCTIWGVWRNSSCNRSPATSSPSNSDTDDDA